MHLNGRLVAGGFDADSDADKEVGYESGCRPVTQHETQATRSEYRQAPGDKRLRRRPNPKAGDQTSTDKISHALCGNEITQVLWRQMQSPGNTETELPLQRSI